MLLSSNSFKLIKEMRLLDYGMLYVRLVHSQLYFTLDYKRPVNMKNTCKSQIVLRIFWSRMNLSSSGAIRYLTQALFLGVGSGW